MAKVKEMEHKAEDADKRLKTRIIRKSLSIIGPVEPTRRLMRFRERHQTPAHRSGLRRAINAMNNVVAFIEAHYLQAMFVSMVGFVAACRFCISLVERDKQLQVPKYLRPTAPILPANRGLWAAAFSCHLFVRARAIRCSGVTTMRFSIPNRSKAI